jgi:uncharacterized protein
MKRLIALLFLLLPGVASAQAWPEHQDLFVNDYANVIEDEAEARIRASLQGLKTETGIEATVLTLYTRWGYGETDQSFEAFATGLFNAWGIGDAETNNGILILVISEDRKMRIELGSGYGRKFNDEAAAIIERIMVPAFQAGDMSKGIEDGTNATIERVAQGFMAGSVPVSAAETQSETNGGSGGLGGLAGGGFIVAMLALFIGLKSLKRLKRCPECGKRGLKQTRKTLTKATRTSQGEGEQTLSCKHCGYAATTLFMIPMIAEAADSSSSGGDFGGGSSSGGGASGDW